MGSISISTAGEVFELLRDDLLAVETEFARQSGSPVAVVTEIASYLMAGGGKRIRPMLLLLAARACGSHSDARIRLGAVVEMLHTATLVHDDIIDESSTRRGRPSSNTTWGNAKCVLAGDWLYMQAFQSALAERNFRVLDLLISLTQQMVEGELLQMEKLGHLINEEEYFDLIFRKTACLFQVSMQLGAVIADDTQRTPQLPLNGHTPRSRNGNGPLPDEVGGNARYEAALGEYGRNLGLAFQIVDDVLDLTATDHILGKPTASDLREGKATLAVIHALERGTGADREAIRTVLADRSFARVTHTQILEILHRHGSLAYAQDTARAYAEVARQSIASRSANFRSRSTSAPCSGFPASSPAATARPATSPKRKSVKAPHPPAVILSGARLYVFHSEWRATLLAATSFEELLRARPHRTQFLSPGRNRLVPVHIVSVSKRNQTVPLIGRVVQQHRKMTNRKKPAHVRQGSWISPPLIGFRYIVATLMNTCFHALYVDPNGFRPDKHSNNDVSQSSRPLGHPEISAPRQRRLDRKAL